MPIDTTHQDCQAPLPTCRYCGKEFTKRKHGRTRVVCFNPECAMKLKQEQNAKRGGIPMEPRPCKYCGELFMPKTKHANRRQHCYAEACIQQEERRHHQQVIENAKVWRESGRPITRKPCPFCGKPMPAGYRYRCDPCARRIMAGADNETMFMTQLGGDE